MVWCQCTCQPHISDYSIRGYLSVRNYFVLSTEKQMQRLPIFYYCFGAVFFLGLLEKTNQFFLQSLRCSVRTLPHISEIYCLRQIFAVSSQLVDSLRCAGANGIKHKCTPYSPLEFIRTDYREIKKHSRHPLLHCTTSYFADRTYKHTVLLCNSSLVYCCYSSWSAAGTDDSICRDSMYGANALIAFAFGITMASAIQCAAGGTN